MWTGCGGLPSLIRIVSQRGPDGSLRVNQTVSEFEMSVVWGARTHPPRDGGPAVNSGPPRRFPRKSPDVRELARPSDSVGPNLKSRILPTTPRPTLFLLSSSPEATGDQQRPAARGSHRRLNAGWFWVDTAAARGRPVRRREHVVVPVNCAMIAMGGLCMPRGVGRIVPRSQHGGDSSAGGFQAAKLAG